MHRRPIPHKRITNQKSIPNVQESQSGLVAAGAEVGLESIKVRTKNSARSSGVNRVLTL